jgi:histone-lysine N-methyltransferase SUV39H
MPTSLPDSINRLSKYTRMDAGIRDVFQAFILENICEDEAGAPEIEIINKVDAEPSPMFEFHYSNRMWYGKDVPMPDYSKLKGCDCVGGCDPKSTTCSCAIRQRKYLELDGCVYEKNGRLKHPRYPIFECNDLCSCGDECRNRVGCLLGSRFRYVLIELTLIAGCAAWSQGSN